MWYRTIPWQPGETTPVEVERFNDDSRVRVKSGLTQYEKAITGTDRRATQKLLAGLRKAWGQ